MTIQALLLMNHRGILEGMSKSYCFLVLYFVKLLFWYRRMFVILLNHSKLETTEG